MQGLLSILSLFCNKFNKYFTGGLNKFHGANLTLSSDVDQDIDVWFA